MRSKAPENEKPPRGRLFGSTAEVHLIGALSKKGSTEKLPRLRTLRKELLRQAPASRQTTSEPPPRVGAISKAVAEALSGAVEPMHVQAIHQVVERLLGKAVNPRSTKACLSAGAHGPRPRFKRTAYGYYRLASGAPALDHGPSVRKTA